MTREKEERIKGEASEWGGGDRGGDRGRNIRDEEERTGLGKRLGENASSTHL